MSTATLSEAAAAYVRTINTHDAAGFIALFAEDAVVNDAGREFRGRDAIKRWCETDIFAANVTLEVLDAAQRGNETVLTTKVDGNFDRTGLPDPVIIDQHITGTNKIVALTCKLAAAKTAV